MPLQTLVVEDSQAIRESIIQNVSQHRDITVVNQFEGIDDTLDFIRTDAHVDLLLLDIKIFGGYAWEILRTLRRENRPIPPVILITADQEKGYAEVAFREFKEEIIAYILKPFEKTWGQRQNEMVLLTKQRLAQIESNTPTLRRLEIKSREGSTFIPIKQIIAFHTTNKGLKFYFDNPQHPTWTESYGVIGTYLNQIKRPDVFVQSSRGIVVNTNYVTKITTYENGTGLAHLKHPNHPEITELKCSKEGRKDLKKAMLFGQ